MPLTTNRLDTPAIVKSGEGTAERYPYGKRLSKIQPLDEEIATDGEAADDSTSSLREFLRIGSHSQSKGRTGNRA